VPTIKNLGKNPLDVATLFSVPGGGEVEITTELLVAFEASPSYRHLCEEPHKYVEVVGRRKRVNLVDEEVSPPTETPSPQADAPKGGRRS